MDSFIDSDPITLPEDIKLKNLSYVDFSPKGSRI